MHIGIGDRLQAVVIRSCFEANRTVRIIDWPQAVMQAGPVLQTVGANLVAFIIPVTTNPVAGHRNQSIDTGNGD